MYLSTEHLISLIIWQVLEINIQMDYLLLQMELKLMLLILLNGNLKLGYQISNSFKLNLYGSFDKFKADFDDGFNFADAENISTTNQYRIGISPTYDYKNGSIVINAAFNKTKREIESGFPTQFNAQSLTADAYNKYNFNDTFYTVLGVNIQNNNMESFLIPFGGTSFEQSINPDSASFTIIDPYANVVYESDFGLSVKYWSTIK